jgi:hypothetical protein
MSPPASNVALNNGLTLESTVAVAAEVPPVIVSVSVNALPLVERTLNVSTPSSEMTTAVAAEVPQVIVSQTVNGQPATALYVMTPTDTIVSPRTSNGAVSEL